MFGTQPGAADVVEQALAANRKLQERLAGLLVAVDRAIWRNAETQAKLKHNAEAFPRAGRYRGMQGGAGWTACVQGMIRARDCVPL